MRGKHTIALGIVSLLMMTAAVAAGNFRSVFKEVRPAESDTTKSSADANPTATVLQGQPQPNAGTEAVSRAVSTGPQPARTLKKPRVVAAPATSAPVAAAPVAAAPAAAPPA